MVKIDAGGDIWAFLYTFGVLWDVIKTLYKYKKIRRIWTSLIAGYTRLCSLLCGLSKGTGCSYIYMEAIVWEPPRPGANKLLSIRSRHSKEQRIPIVIKHPVPKQIFIFATVDTPQPWVWDYGSRQREAPSPEFFDANDTPCTTKLIYHTRV